MSCNNCCNQTNLCGFGVGLDAPANTTAVSVLLTNSGSINCSNTSTSFSVNGQGPSGTGFAQLVLEGCNFFLITNNGQKQIPSISFNSSLCYFMGIRIQNGNFVGTVIDSNGSQSSASIATSVTSFAWGFVMTEDNVNTYVFFQPAWDWVSVSGCGMSASFWSHGFVYHGQQVNCMGTYSTKESFNSGSVEITLGPNATSSPSCGTQLW